MKPQKQVQDTIVKPQLSIGTPSSSGLVIERNSIELSALSNISTDSVRVAPKPKRRLPIKKTVPFIPSQDSIDHPYFNTLTGKYEFPDNEAEQGTFLFDPIENTASYVPVIVAGNPEPVLVEKPKLKETISLFDSQTKKEDANEGFGQTDWMLGIIIFVLIVFGWIRVAYGRYLQIVVQASYNYFAERRIQDEGNISRKRTFNFMNVLYFIVVGLFSAQAISYFHYSVYDLSGIVLFVVCVAFWVMIYGLKGLFFSILDFIFLAKGAFVSYLTTVFIYNKMLSFIMVPIVSVLPFVPKYVAPWLFKLGIAAFVILYIMRLFRGIQTGFKNRLSISYLILYLCALEILPMLVIFKMIAGFI